MGQEIYQAAGSRFHSLKACLIREVGSPLQVHTLRPVTDCNCVAARLGGEQPDVNDPSVG